MKRYKLIEEGAFYFFHSSNCKKHNNDQTCCDGDKRFIIGKKLNKILVIDNVLRSKNDINVTDSKYIFETLDFKNINSYYINAELLPLPLFEKMQPTEEEINCSKNTVNWFLNKLLDQLETEKYISNNDKEHIEKIKIFFFCILQDGDDFNMNVL